MQIKLPIGLSASQPHVRTIKRGKAEAATEFGAKISASLVDGFSYIDHISWDNYNESGDLKEQSESYHNRFGYYPESVHAEKIYRNRKNLNFVKITVSAFQDQRREGPPKKMTFNAKYKHARMSWIASQLKASLVKLNAASVYQRSCANWLKP